MSLRCVSGDKHAEGIFFVAPGYESPQGLFDDPVVSKVLGAATSGLMNDYEALPQEQVSALHDRGGIRHVPHDHPPRHTA